VVTERPRTQVTAAAFEIATLGSSFPGPAVRHFPIRVQWAPGVQTVDIHWDGRDDSSKQVPAGTYRLRATTTVNEDRDVICDDGSGQGVERFTGASEGAGEIVTFLVK
jgi:hypothetical protein